MTNKALDKETSTSTLAYVCMQQQQIFFMQGKKYYKSAAFFKSCF